MKKYTKLLFILICFPLSVSLWAADFGLVFDQVASYEGNDGFDYSGILIPRFTTLLGENGRLYISAGAKIQSDPFTVVPELLRTELSWRFDNKELSVGRMPYSDPLGYIANGLFDGAYLSVDTNMGTFSAGAWYTGLLYKKRVDVAMTIDEMQSNSEDFEYSDFLNSYFAPKRAFMALGWEHPALKEFISMQVSLLAQFDFTGADIHSQYAALKLSFPYRDFLFGIGGCFELMEVSGEFGIGLVGELSASWMLPTAIEDRLSLLARFSSGNFEDSVMNAFMPINLIPQGDFLQARISGLSFISLDYLGRFHKTLSAGLSTTYYIGSDLNTNTLLGNEGYFWGLEFYGHVSWSPFSDMQVNLGGGVFLPSLGNASPDAEARWRIELNVVLSLY